MATPNQEAGNAARLTWARRPSLSPMGSQQQGGKIASSVASMVPGTSALSRLGILKNRAVNKGREVDPVTLATTAAKKTLKFIITKIAWVIAMWIVGLIVAFLPWLLIGGTVLIAVTAFFYI